MNMPQNIYMSGIGGIGMSALAQLLVSQGKYVTGSDRSQSPTTDLLESKGVSIFFEQLAENIPVNTELLIYSDAIHTDNPERVYASQNNIPQLSYFEALGVVSEGMRTIAVAGTHGKTTTTGMLAKILRDTGHNPTAIVGSIVRDFESNFLNGRSDLLVVEACEYRDHLLKLNPEILVITNLELDHTDYFPNLEALQNTFRIAVSKVPSHGFIITNPHDPTIAAVLGGAGATIVDYTLEEVPKLAQIGEFNVANARAALATARAAFPEIAFDVVSQSLSTFQGSWRRFDYKGETPLGALVYDDYAHHPTAIEKTIIGVRERFPDQKVVVAFHPHLYSRTKSLLNEFAMALVTADVALVAPIYAAREENDPTVSSEILAAAACEAGGHVTAYNSFDEIRHELLQYKNDTIIITMGAGDIYKVAEEIVD